MKNYLTAPPGLFLTKPNKSHGWISIKSIHSGFGKYSPKFRQITLIMCLHCMRLEVTVGHGMGLERRRFYGAQQWRDMFANASGFWNCSGNLFKSK